MMRLYCACDECIYYENWRINGRVEDGNCVRDQLQISESGTCERQKLKYNGFALCVDCEGTGEVKLLGIEGSHRCPSCDGNGFRKVLEI